ncbi:MAG TPA: mechanosensitive ion channel family protein [Bacteroidia bacterium]|nr:mechanosensitive ion channel family protein [Bacteroidia bacterium]
MERIFWGNPISNYIWCLGILVFGILFRQLLSKGLSWLAYKLLRNYSQEEVGYKKFLELLRKPFSFFIAILTIYFAFSQLNFPSQWHVGPVEKWGLRMFLLRSVETLIVISFTWIVLRIVDFGGLILMDKALKTESKSDDQIIPFVKESVKIIVMIISLFSILGAVYNMDITSLIAGLGIGGLAIALAAKESLENLLGSFTIFFDKPFIIGDLIKVGNVEGNVEKIGFRSTRIRTLEKTFVTVPNKKLVDTELDNLTNREIRRIKFDFGLRYDTPLESIHQITQEIKLLIENDSLRYDEVSVYFYEFGQSALIIRVIYFANTAVWTDYMVMREKINYSIVEIVKKHGAKFAFPTQNIFIENGQLNGA